MNRIGVALVLVAAVIAAGCQSAFGPTVRRTAGVEGNWVDTNGVGLSSFNGGAFTTVAADTGNKLSEGSYRYTDGRSVEITIRSIVRNTTDRANCTLVTTAQMNCTLSSGARFSLVRQRRV